LDGSHKMRLAIEAEAQNLPSQMFSNFISRLVSSGINLLNYDLKDSRYRIVGLVVLDCLLDINDEIMAERRVEIANQLRKVLENEKQNIEITGDVIRKASEAIGHLARVASTTEIEFLDFYVAKSIECLSPRKGDANKFSSVLILTQLAINSPALIFMKRKSFFSMIWEMIFDRNALIREAAAGSLSAVLLLVSQRESTDEYIRQALHHMDIGYNSNTGEKIHGFLLIFDCLLSVSVIPSMELLNTIRNVNMRLQDLFWEVLQRKDSRDQNIKQKVLILIPKLAALSQATFIQHNQFTAPLNFLSFSVRHLLDVIYAHKDRSVAYLALGNFLISMAPAIKGVNAIIDDVFAAIKIGFKDPFCIEALDCLSVVVRASGGGHGFVDSELVNAMFQGGLTPELIKSLKVIVKTTPSIRGHVQTKLRAHITNILLNHTVKGEDLNQPGIARRTASNAPPRRPLAAVPPTLLSGLFSSKPIATVPKRGPLGGGGGGLSQEPSTDNELVLALQVLASFDFLPNQFNDSRSRNKSFQSQFSLSSSWTEKHSNSSSSLSSPSSIAGNESEMLLRVVREGVVRYLDDANPAIRDAAAITCATVLNKVVDTVEETAGDGGKYLIQVMDRLLMLGVGDECEEIRVHVFLSLPPSLDHIISNSENVHCLIEAMNDESFDVRSAAMSVLARVAHYDTVHVMPLVRLMLSKLMRQLLNSKDHLLRQESVQLLQAMVKGTNVLIVPYVWQIMEPLLASLDDPSPAIVSAAVSTIGELARVSPEDIEVHLHVLFPRLIQALNDHSSVNKQEICVIALGKVVSSLNIVSKPYTTYPSLFESLVRAIQRSDVAAASLRLQAMRTIGLLGAIDADSYQKSLRAIGVLTVLPSQGDFDDEEGDKKKDEAERPCQETEEDDQLISLDKYYLSVVVNSLMTILRDASLSSHHQTAVGVTLRIVRILGFQSDPLLENVINAFTFRFYHSDTGGALQESILDHLITMVYVVGRDISRHLSTIVKLTSDCFNTHLGLCLSMVEALCFILFPQDFNGVLREVLPCMVQVNRDELLQDRDELINTRNEPASSDQPPLNALGPSKKAASLPKSSKIFTTIANISPALGEYRRQLIPVILKVVEENSVRPETRREALCAVMQLAIDSSDLNEFASRIIHPLLRLLSGSEMLLQTTALTSLSCMVCRLRTSYLPFVIPAKRKISQILVQRDSMATRVPFPQLDEYESLVSLLLKQKPLPLNPSDRSTITIKSEDNISSRMEKCRTVHTSLRVEFRALEAAWTLSGRTTTSDLVEWMRRLSIEFIRQSPSPIIRPCAVLAKVYQPLAHELFNAAFVSVWDEIFLQDNADSYADIPLISGLEMALRSPQIPGNIRQVLLNLTEFMDMQDKRLPLDIQLLAKQAEAANMFAKCLHYREIEFNSVNTLPSSECIEALITVNSQLGMKEAASGVLTFVRDKHKHIQIEPYWLEKLTRWQEARDSYTEQSDQWRTSHPEDTPAQHESWMNSELGILRCLHALGEDTDLCSSAREVLSHVRDVEGQVDSYDIWMTEVQRLGANAAWMLGKWDQMEQFLDGGTLGKHHDVQLENDGTFYEAVFAIHRCDYRRASKLVGETREAVSSNISSLLSESYSRAYRSMVTMQVLSELEELIDYRKYESKMLLGTGFTALAVDISSCLTRRLSNGAPGGGGELYEESTLELLDELKQRKFTLVQKWQRRLHCAPREVDVYRLILVRETRVWASALLSFPHSPLLPHLTGCAHLARGTKRRPGELAGAGDDLPQRKYAGTV
jgi:serine/threonine-protein kinase mTOR